MEDSRHCIKTSLRFILRFLILVGSVPQLKLCGKSCTKYDSSRYSTNIRAADTLVITIYLKRLEQLRVRDGMTQRSSPRPALDRNVPAVMYASLGRLGQTIGLLCLLLEVSVRVLAYVILGTTPSVLPLYDMVTESYLGERLCVPRIVLSRKHEPAHSRAYYSMADLNLLMRKTMPTTQRHFNPIPLYCVAETLPVASFGIYADHCTYHPVVFLPTPVAFAESIEV